MCFLAGASGAASAVWRIEQRLFGPSKWTTSLFLSCPFLKEKLTLLLAGWPYDGRVVNGRGRGPAASEGRLL